MWKQIIPALRMLVALTILTGVVYPLVVTVAAQVLFPAEANGSLIRQGEQVVGSALIGQHMNADARYFWTRPSAISYNPQPSGGSNLGPTSATLQTLVEERRTAFASANGVSEAAVPAEMLFASASGLDPHISPEAARLQVLRVAAARGLEATVVEALVNRYVEEPQLGFLGQPRVNVLRLNLALDGLQS